MIRGLGIIKVPSSTAVRTIEDKNFTFCWTITKGLPIDDMIALAAIKMRADFYTVTTPMMRVKTFRKTMTWQECA